MSQIIGERTTYQTINNESRLVRLVEEEIGYLEPNEGPLITFLSRMKKRQACTSPRIEWYEDDYQARWAQNSATTVANNTGSTTVTVADGTLFVVGDIVAVPRALGNATAPELFRVTAIATNTLTVVRDVGANGVDTISANAALTIIGSANEEGGALPAFRSTTPSSKITYTQIFRDTIDFTKTMVAAKVYAYNGSERQREHMKKLKEHKIKLNRAALFGKASESLTGGPNGKPIRTTDGINSIISSNIVDAGGILNQKTFESFSRLAFRYGSKEKLLLCAPIIKSAINDFAKGYLMVRPGETVLGVRVQKVTTAHGDWMVVNDWMLENGVAGQNGFGNLALSLDLTQMKMRYLSNNGMNRDTKISEDIVKDGGDRIVDEILTEAAFQFRQEKWHAKLHNVTDYQA